MPSVPGPHTGILREENCVLRQIFGYGDKTTTLDPLPRTGSPLPGTSIKDVLLVAVDVDTGGGYEVIGPNQSFHVGVSTFDTRWLTSDNLADPTQAIASCQFINQETKPCKSAAKRFLSGATEMMTIHAIAWRILSITQDRDYVLIGHGLKEDLKVLNNINPEITARACYILDTVKSVQHILRLYYRYSLERLLDSLSIPYDPYRLHAAGNDAHFALKGLLMMVALDITATRQACALGNQETIDRQSLTAATLEAVARVPYPTPAAESDEAVGPEKPPKLSIGAKRRARQARKAIRRANKYQEGIGGLDQDRSHDHTSTMSNGQDIIPPDGSCSGNADLWFDESSADLLSTLKPSRPMLDKLTGLYPNI